MRFPGTDSYESIPFETKYRSQIHLTQTGE